MGVSIKTAVRWEQYHEYQIADGCDLLPAFRDLVNHHFATARTKAWDARLKEYWSLNEYKRRDEEKFGDYRWIEFTPADIKIAHAFKPDRFSLYRLEYEERNPISYQLRSTIHMCKQMRRDEFHGFMHLPSEIRDMIYSYALHKGKVIVPNSSRATRRLEPVKYYLSDDGFLYGRYQGLEEELSAMGDGRRARPKPLGLVQGVSREVHDEAARVYFGGNQFVFPAGEFLLPSHCNLLRASPSATLPTRWNRRDRSGRNNNAPLLRDVSYTFDMRDHPSDDYSNLYRSYEVKLSIDAGSRPPGELLRALHDQKALHLEVDWAERVDSIKRMTLDRLVLDFEECYCAIGCCRRVGWVLDRFLHEGPPPGTQDTEGNAYSYVDWAVRPPLVVEVMGFVSDEEKAMGMEKLKKLPGSEVRFVARVATNLSNLFDKDLVWNVY